MFSIFATLLLIATGVTASEICRRHDSCDRFAPDEPMGMPETEEELQQYCQFGIKQLECKVDYGKRCRHKIPKWMKPIGSSVLDTAREICSEETLLHAAVVDNLKCYKKLIQNYNSYGCRVHDASSEHIQQIAEALSEEGLLTLHGNETDVPEVMQFPCIRAVNYYACWALVIERECGTVAMNAAVEVLSKAGPGALVGCEDSYHLVPAMIRLRKEDEEHK